jgi:hypothetical protein
MEIKFSALRAGFRFTPQKYFYFCLWYSFASVVYWSDLLAADPEVPGSIPALLDFLSSSGSRMGSTQPSGLEN